MAIIDPDSDAVVIRIAYDGAPMAGKTTSVVALGRCLGAGVKSPAEVNGRTLYFDWLDYTGGLFEGRRIRCQVISVPGQASLAPRRLRLLEEADAIVFVGDSTPAGFEADRGYLGRLAQFIEQLPGPPVGVIMQANKRDHADAVPLDHIRDLLDGLGMRVGVTESVATEGAGVRETFVFAVRLALDRVRELMRTDALLTCRPQVDTAEDLLAELKRAESGASDLPQDAEPELRQRPGDVAAPSIGHTVAQAMAQVIEENAAPRAPVIVVRAPEGEHVPLLPDDKVASGCIWPPVDGRLVLNELAGAHIRLSRNSRGDWCGVANERWRLLSPADAVFEDLEQGRAVLVNAARANAERGDALPGRRHVDRCLTLAADGVGRQRLWTISRLVTLGTDVPA